MEVIPRDELVQYLNQYELYNLILVNKYLFSSYKTYLSNLKKWLDKRARYLNITIIFSCDFTIDKITYHFIDGNENFIIAPTTINFDQNYFLTFNFRSIIKKLAEIENIKLLEGDLIYIDHVSYTINEKTYHYNNRAYYYDGKLYHNIDDYKESIRNYDEKKRSMFYWIKNKNSDYSCYIPRNKVIFHRDSAIEILTKSLVKFKLKMHRYYPEECKVGDFIIITYSSNLQKFGTYYCF